MYIKRKSLINTTYSPTSSLFAFHTNKKQYLNNRRKEEMHLRMHNNDFDIFLRSVHNSTKQYISKIDKNVQKRKCYLYKASWEFKFDLAQYDQIFLCTPHLISLEPCKYTVGKSVHNIVEIGYVCSEKRNP